MLQFLTPIDTTTGDDAAEFEAGATQAMAGLKPARRGARYTTH